MSARVLAGPVLTAGAESLRDHVARLGGIERHARADVLSEVEASGLLGRGGAGYPVARKWRQVAACGAAGSAGAPIVLVNGAEGEPLSSKDRAVMTLRPHLVLDGALLAARVTGATEIVLYVGSAHTGARRSLLHALGERQGRLPMPVRVVAAPDRYVAGEASAAVHHVNAGDARPTMAPPRPTERGIDDRPTLVQNVESLAHAALIARFGADWYRDAGQGPTRGTALVSLSGVPRLGVRELDLGTAIGQLAEAAGLDAPARADTQAALLGGYFGGWLDAAAAWDLALDPVALRAAGAGLGCGVISFLAADWCGVAATARIMDYMAGQSAAQCGPCVFGLRAIADATARLAGGAPLADDLARLERWSGQLVGRGACRHPDGAVGLLASALAVFGEEFAVHQARHRCPRRAADGVAA